MENTLYVNSVLDNDFKQLVNDKIHLLKKKIDGDTYYSLSIAEVLKVASVIEETRPKSKMRIHKKQILLYLDYFDKHKPEMLTQKEIDALLQKYIFQSNYLMRPKGYIYQGL